MIGVVSCEGQLIAVKVKKATYTLRFTASSTGSLWRFHLFSF